MARRRTARLSLVGLVAATLLALGACAPSAPPAATKSAAAPTTAPAPAAKPAESKPAESKPAEAAKPAPAASPAAAPAASPAAALAASPVAKPAGPAKQMNFGVTTNFNNLPLFVGVDRGIFLKHGVDVKLKTWTQGNELAKALVAKEIEAAIQAQSNFLPALEQELPMVAISSLTGDVTRKISDENLTLTAREGSGIKTIQDLKGKKIAFNGAGTTDEYAKAVLAKANISPSDVQMVNLAPGVTANAMRTGQADAAVTIEPFGTQILETVPGSTLVSRGGYLSYFVFIISRPDVVQSDPDLLQRFMNGFAEATQYTRQNPDQAGQIATVWVTGLDANIAKKAIGFMAYDPRISKAMMEALEDNRKILVEQKKIKGTIDGVKAVDTRFIDKTLETHPQFFSDLKPTELFRR